MSLFKKMESTQAKLKAGAYGGTGSGKTYTASEIAVGLHKLIKSKKPVYFYDTETGSDFVKPRFTKEGIELLQLKSRSFSDLLTGIREAEKEASVLIIDSITHVWEDFKKAYLKKTRQPFIQLWDWAKLKETWMEFTDLYVNSDLHIVLCGREAAIYEQTEEVRGGETKKVAIKVGAKMKSESEQGYEPSLLIQMEKVYLNDGTSDGIYVRRAHVVKDRFDAIDSKDFDNPKFEDFMPHIKLLNLSGQQMGIDTARTSEDVFGDLTGDNGRTQRARRRAILCEEMVGLLTHYFPTTNAVDKKAKTEIVFALLGTRSWKAVEEDWALIPLEKLELLMKPTESTPCPLEAECIKEQEKLQAVGK